MAQTEKLSLKAFWDALEQQLAARSDDELRAILRALAQETSPVERQAFLDRLKPALPASTHARKIIEPEELLADIDDLVSEIKENPEADEYWEERHGYYDEWGESNDDDSLGPYDEFVEPLTGLFDRAQAAFDYGDLDLARAAYQKLFEEALQVEDDYGRGVRIGDLSDVDSGEAYARYLRAVYETESPARRPTVLFEQMQRVRLWLSRLPRLDDIIQISTKPLPDQDRFFTDWIAFLRKQSGHEADAWLREAIRLSQGTAGLAELARAEGKKLPRAYLDWFTALEGEGEHLTLLAAAQQALQELPTGLPIRAAIADHLCAAAIKLKDDEALRAGRWEAFAAKPMLFRLLDLWEATPLEAQPEMMSQAAQHIKDQLARPSRASQMDVWHEDDLEQPGWIDTSVLAHAYLLAGDWDAAHQLAARQKSLGWSSSDNAQGLVTATFLVLSSGKLPDALPPSLAQLWEERLQASAGGGYWGEDAGSNILKRLKQIYAQQLPRAAWGKEQPKKFLPWCLKVANQRVDAIVGNQKRGSYGKAAVLITACAETVRLRDGDKEADALLNDVRNRFPRHRAFLAELDASSHHKRRK